MADFVIVDGDVEPSVSVVLTDDTGAAQDLTAAVIDRLDLRMCLNGVIRIFTAIITDGLGGMARVDFPVAGLAPGTYSTSWTVFLLSGGTKTFQKNSAGEFYTIDVERRRC